MDCKRDKITLYSPQSSQVAEIIRREGVCFSRPEFISKKYGESAPLFLTVYSWFVREAAKIVPPPPGASFPYWAVADPKSVDRSAGGELLVLSVPADQVILFDLYDWNKILQLRPLTDDPQEEKELLAGAFAAGAGPQQGDALQLLPGFSGADFSELAAAFPPPSGPAAGGL